MPVSNSSDGSSIKGLYSLRKRYPQNSIRNKLNDLKTLISDSVGILCVAESKQDESFLNSEIALEGFKKPYRLDLTASSGGLLINVKASSPSKIINHYNFQKDIQRTAVELNVANKKCYIFHIQTTETKYKLLLKQSIRGT